MVMSTSTAHADPTDTKKESLMTTTTKITVCTAAAVVALVLAGSLSACSQQQLASFATGSAPYHPSYWVVEADTSGSTAPQARRGGSYEKQIMAALAQAGREQATVFAAAIDGNAIGDAAWQIDGVPLRSTGGGGNSNLAEASRVHKAAGLRGQVQTLLASRPTNGSDILGALQQVAQLGHDLPAGAPKTLVLLTDGAINLSRYGGYDVYNVPPDTVSFRRTLIAQFEREGELPKLAGWKVYLGGIGVGVGDRRTARGVVALWEELIPAAGAQLVQINPSLAFG
jgi:hypothetical protein